MNEFSPEALAKIKQTLETQSEKNRQARANQLACIESDISGLIKRRKEIDAGIDCLIEQRDQLLAAIRTLDFPPAPV